MIVTTGKKCHPREQLSLCCLLSGEKELAVNDFSSNDNTDPIEDFINKHLNLDDLSGLANLFSKDDPFSCEVVHPILNELLDEIGQPTPTVWGDQLTPLELQLRACLTEDLIESLIRTDDHNFPNVEQMSDDEIRKLMTFPLTLAMMAVRFFRERGWYDDPQQPGR
jgi:hypothetical protein